MIRHLEIHRLLRDLQGPGQRARVSLQHSTQLATQAVARDGLSVEGDDCEDDQHNHQKRYEPQLGGGPALFDDIHHLPDTSNHASAAKNMWTAC